MLRWQFDVRRIKWQAINQITILHVLLYAIMSQNALTIQLAFVQKLKELAPANASLADEIAELLNVSADSAYRRLRGETSISLDEAVAICNHFKVPFSAFTESLAGLVTFRYKELDDDEESLYKYLKGLEETLDMLMLANEKKIVYGMTDIPILHQLGFREIGSFKMFYWMRALMGVKSLEAKKFNPNIVSPDLQRVGSSVYTKYKKVPSIEIWSDDLLFPTLKQIEYSWDSGWFDSQEIALSVCENLREMLFNAREMAETGSKIQTGDDRPLNYQLYFSELLIGNNTIMAHSDNLRAVYLSHHTFNNINTTNEEFCNQTEEWLEKHIKKSTLISGTAEKQRMKFFNLLERNVDKVIAKIKAD